MHCARPHRGSVATAHTARRRPRCRRGPSPLIAAALSFGLAGLGACGKGGQAPRVEMRRDVSPEAKGAAKERGPAPDPKGGTVPPRRTPDPAKDTARCWPLAEAVPRRVLLAKLEGAEPVPPATLARIRAAVPAGWTVDAAGNACRIRRTAPLRLYGLIGQDKRAGEARGTFAHAFVLTLYFGPRLPEAALARRAAKMADLRRWLRRQSAQVIRSGMSGQCFRPDVPPALVTAYKRRAYGLELLPTLYDANHGVTVVRSTDDRYWGVHDPRDAAELRQVETRVSALFRAHATPVAPQAAPSLQ